MNLVFLERVALEALYYGKKSIESLSKESLINKKILEKITKRFIKEEILSNNDSFLKIDYRKEKKAFLEMKKIENIKNEIRELFGYFINIYLIKRDRLQFGLKKIWLQKDEQNVLEHHLYQIDELLKKVEKRNLNGCNKDYISMKKVFFWGYCNYSDLIKEALKK